MVGNGHLKKAFDSKMDKLAKEKINLLPTTLRELQRDKHPKDEPLYLNDKNQPSPLCASVQYDSENVIHTIHYKNTQKVLNMHCDAINILILGPTGNILFDLDLVKILIQNELFPELNKEMSSS